MDRELIKKHNLNESISNFCHLVEYTTLGGSGIEEDVPAAPMADPNAAAPAPMPPAPAPAPMDPNAAAPVAPTAPATMAPNAAAPVPPVPPAPPAPKEAEGFTPQDEKEDTPSEEPSANMEMPEEMLSDDEYNEGQEETARKIDDINAKFEKLMSMISSFENKIADSDMHIEQLKSEMEKRNPTPVEKLNMRAKDGYPFTDGVKDYWDRKTPDNYETDPQAEDKYVIKKSDIDNISDWGNISKEMRGQNLGLKDILNF